MKTKNIVLLVIYLITLAYVFYLLFFNDLGPYYFKPGGIGDGPEPRLHMLFLIAVLLLFVTPLVLYFRTKSKFWLLPSLAVLCLTLFWKSGPMQCTLFYNSPRSLCKSMQERIDFVDRHRDQVAQVIDYIENEIGADTLKRNSKYEIILITAEAVKKQLHRGFKDTTYREIVDGQPKTVHQQLKMVETLSEFNLPPAVSVKLKGFKIDNLSFKEGKIHSAIISAFPSSINSEVFYQPVFLFYPHGRELEEEAGKHFKYYKSSFYREHYCSSDQYYLDDFWSFNIVGICFG